MGDRQARAQHRPMTTIKQKERQVVIVIDDGIATGATTRAALQAIRNRKSKEIGTRRSRRPTRHDHGIAPGSRCLDLLEDAGTIWGYRLFLS